MGVGVSIGGTPAEVRQAATEAAFNWVGATIKRDDDICTNLRRVERKTTPFKSHLESYVNSGVCPFDESHATQL
jgi:hypothetical protein